MAKLPLDSSYEATPAASESKGSLGAQRIRETRENARYPMQTEHNVGSVSSNFTNDGRHSMGSARAFVGATAPTTLLRPNDTGALTTAEMPSGTLSNGSAISAAIGATDAGRIWVDTSGYVPVWAYWTGTAWAPLEPRENLLPNGLFDVWQRQPSATAVNAPNTANTYIADRWFVKVNAGTATVDRETAALPTGAVAGAAIEVNAAASVTTIDIGTRLTAAEAVALGAGAASALVTITAKFKHSGTTATLTPSFRLGTTSVASDTAANKFFVANVTNQAGAGATFSAITNGNSLTVSHTFNIGTGSITNGVNGLELVFRITGGTGATTEKIMLTDVVLGFGRVTPTVRRLAFADELERCLPRYQKTFEYGTAAATASGSFLGAIYARSNSGAACGSMWHYQRELQRTPTATFFNPTQANANWRNNGNTTDGGVVTSIRTSTKNLSVSQNAAGSDDWLVHAQADAEFYDA